jgi:Beta-galactosidase
MRTEIASLAFFLFSNLVALAGSAPKERSSGIFDLLPGDTVKEPVNDLAGKPCWNNPNIAGVVLRTDWAKIEPSENAYDWTYLDTGVARAQASNKKIAISVQAGINSPEWIYTLGAQGIKIPGYGTMPLPWDSVFQKNWASLVKQLGARYDGVSVVAYVTMGGPGRTEQLYVCTSPYSVRDFNRDGGTEAWTQAAEAIMEMYAAAFPNTPFLYAYGSPDAHPKSSVPFSNVISYGVNKYPERFGIKSDALHPKMSPSFWPNVYIPALSSSTTVGYQMLKEFAGSTVDGGTLREALNSGVSKKAHFIEVYNRDCDDQKEQRTISEANKDLLSDYP